MSLQERRQNVSGNLVEGMAWIFKNQNFLTRPKGFRSSFFERNRVFLSEYHFDPLQENGINLLQDEILRRIMVRKKYLKQPGD